MSDMHLEREVLDFPQCPTCHASLVDSVNYMVTPTHCDLCWHLSLQETLVKFFTYLGLAWILYHQLLRLLPWFI
jgi:hypothetical protein